MKPSRNTENMNISESGKTFLNWSQEKQNAAKARLWNEFGLHRFFNDTENGQCQNITDEEYLFLVKDFNVREHFVITLNHKKFILKSYTRFQTFLESINLKREQVEKHDDSKLTNFLEIIGYTQRWIWNTKTDVWMDAWKHHYTTNSHHPEYYCYSSEDDKIQQENMEYLDIVESVIDMLACRWERKLDGKEDVKNEDLLDIEDVFLNRYTDNDRSKVKIFLRQLLSLPDKTI